MECGPQSLFAAVKQITDQFLAKRRQDKARSYVKMDYKIVKGEQRFGIQLTKCGLGQLDLSLVLADQVKAELRGKTGLATGGSVLVGLVESKGADQKLERKRLVFERSAYLVPAGDAQEPAAAASKEFAKLKNYLCLRLLFQVDNGHLEDFSSLMLSYVMHAEQLDPNVKFILRINEEYLYRNYVRMDDVVLSCKILADSCAIVFQGSESDRFRRDLMSLMRVKRAADFEKSLGSLLISQANNNFVTAPCSRDRS